MKTITRTLLACLCMFFTHGLFAQTDSLIVDGDTATYTAQVDRAFENLERTG